MDTDQVEAALEALSSIHRTAVAIVCAERAADLHAIVSGSETEIIRDAINSAWELLHQPHETPPERVSNLRRLLSERAPDSEEGDNVELFACASADAALASLHDDNACKHAVFGLLDTIESAAATDESAERCVTAELNAFQDLCATVSSSDSPTRESLLPIITSPVSFDDSAPLQAVPNFDPGSRVFAKDERFELCVGDKATQVIKRPLAVGPTLESMRIYAANYIAATLQSDEILIAIDGYSIAEIGNVHNGDIVWSIP